MTELEEIFARLNIAKSKAEEIKSKPAIQKNLSRIFSNSRTDNKLHYTLACLANKDTSISVIADFIDENLITHEDMLKLVIKEGKMSREDTRLFIEQNSVSDDQVFYFIEKAREDGLSKKDILYKLKAELPGANFRTAMPEINKINEDSHLAAHAKTREFDWLNEGEIKKLHKPGDNPQLNEKIRNDHLSRTGGMVVTRFPPEPNGHLHIGHAKAINLSFEYARKFGGITYLRYDDTNPKSEREDYFESILEDIEWLGFKPHKITASSDYFDKMVEFAFKLLKEGNAYVCHLGVQEVREARKRHTLDPLFPLSPYRDRLREENIKVFREMLDGKWDEGKAVLRFKMSSETKNPLMLDLVGMRVIKRMHPKTDDKYVVYPTYEFALCVCDSLEDITHSFCSREFFTRQESYNWLVDTLEIYKPVQWEFNRLNISNTVLSKRKLQELVKMGMSWDDPRLFTLKGLKRRGFTPRAINEFCRNVGLTFSESIIDVKVLENFVRDDLNKIARRVMCVKDPLKVFIRNGRSCDIEISDLPVSDTKRKIKFTPTIYIERGDFNEEADGDFMRLTLTQPVGLYMYKPIRVIKVTDDGLIAELCNEKPKKYIHWVGEDSIRVELRLYSSLFNSFNPEEVGYLNDMCEDSLKIVEGLCDTRIAGCKPLDKFQFQRIGYFCVDYESSENKAVFNHTLPLRNVVQ